MTTAGDRYSHCSSGVLYVVRLSISPLNIQRQIATAITPAIIVNFCSDIIADTKDKTQKQLSTVLQHEIHHN